SHGATERRSSFLARFFVCRCDAIAIERGGKYRPLDLALTSMQINGKMVVLAREIRGMTQQYLASRLSMSLYALSRVERRLVEAVSNQEALTLADALEFPVEFFRQDGTPAGSAASPCCPAGRTVLDEADQKRVRGILTVLRINIGKLLGTVRIVPCRKLPTFAHEPSGVDPERAAAAIRSLWKIPGGPIANLGALVESAGVVIVRSDFGMSTLGATSQQIAGMPPLILIDRAIPVDQCRMMLAHQLAHLVMHQESVSAQAEAEADTFALELLLPRSQMESAFQTPARIVPDELERMRIHWRVAATTLLDRALALNLIDTDTRNRLWTSARLRRHPAEPQPPSHEEAATLREMLDCFMRERGFGIEELTSLFRIGMRDVAAWYGTAIARMGARASPESPGCTVVSAISRNRGAATGART
ncbi:MAG TPA: ImmA/IrrE family metallo-endopeptidase, partial [Rudaea sp.]|nr:ImmA/IrrE family metallo-endopeptidase [Rudaea sp.]